MQYIKGLLWNNQTKQLTQSHNEKYIIMTYRSKIIKAHPSTYYNSDTGWGCMLRVGQMLLANIFYKKQKLPINDILKLAYDNQLMPLSIQSFTKISQQIYPQKKQYQWYTPCQCGFIIKKLFDKVNHNYRVSVCNDNSIFLEKIQLDRPKIMLLVMCRIGLDKPQKQYLQCVKKITLNPFFFAIMGGIPKRAHLFLKNENGYFGYLDPHTTNKTPTNLQELPGHATQYVTKLSWLKETKIDTSMSICFIFRQEHIDKFWKSMLQLKQQLGQAFFIYMAQKQPQYNSSQIIELQ